MFFGLTTLFAIVIVDVETAPDGVVVGLPGDDVDELDDPAPHAPAARAPAAAETANQNAPVFKSMPSLDPKTGGKV